MSLHYLMVIVLQMLQSLNSGAGCCNFFSFNDWQHCLKVAILYSVMNKGLQGCHDDIGNSYFIKKYIYILGIYGNIFYSCLFIRKSALQAVC